MTAAARAMSQGMSFAVTMERSTAGSCVIEHHLVPWDTEILGYPTAQLASLRFDDTGSAEAAYAAFLKWAGDHGVRLCACRLPQQAVASSLFLQAKGFRFVELNYRPETTGLDGYRAGPGLSVRAATDEDRAALVALATDAFETGRFHVDPRIGPALAGRRYGIWMANAFARADQEVLVCDRDGRTVGFFVVERPDRDSCFWSLNGLAPGLAGQGLGGRVWRTMLSHHRREGVRRVGTSVSSHNIAAMNLYASLGFRFPAPSASYHLWFD